MRRGLFLITCVLICTTACVGPTQFTKPGGTSEQFTLDRDQCLYEAKLNRVPPLMWPDMVRSCLKARGYTNHR